MAEERFIFVRVPIMYAKRNNVTRRMAFHLSFGDTSRGEQKEQEAKLCTAVSPWIYEVT